MMKKILAIIASFAIMLCLGSIYAWSIFAEELVNKYNWYSYQTQLVFGMVIAIFPLTMIFLRTFKHVNVKLLLIFSSILLTLGYLLAGYSKGNFILALLGIGVIVGIATGIGYLVSLSTPVLWYPQKRGFVMGIIVGGFGLAAVALSFIAEKLLLSGKNIFQIFQTIGIIYGIIILLFSFLIPSAKLQNENHKYKSIKLDKTFLKLILGIFLGTFAGLLIIGSLKPIGSKMNIDSHTLVISVSAFAITNFLGRITWGFISDKIYTSLVISMALLLQSLSIIALLLIPSNDLWFIIISSLIGFAFGGNFILFAKETTSKFGSINFSFFYPIVFLGYAVAGIVGPFVGGILYDIFNNYTYSIAVASIVSIVGSIIFFNPNNINRLRNVSSRRN